MMSFYAKFKGVDLDSQEDTKDRFDEVKRRADAQLSGRTVDELEFEDLGIEVETE